MIALSNNVAQTLTPGQSMTFNTVVRYSGRSETFRLNSGSVGLRTNNCCPAPYTVSFSANVTNTAAGPVQLAIAIGGSPIAESTMISTPAAVGDFNSVSRTIPVTAFPGASNTVTVTNNGTADIVIGANPILYIVREG